MGRDDTQQYIKTMSEFIMKQSAERHGLMKGLNASRPEQLTGFCSESIAIGADVISCCILNVLANCKDRELLQNQMFQEIFTKIQQQVCTTDIDAKVREFMQNEKDHSRSNQH